MTLRSFKKIGIVVQWRLCSKVWFGLKELLWSQPKLFTDEPRFGTSKGDDSHSDSLQQLLIYIVIMCRCDIQCILQETCQVDGCLREWTGMDIVIKIVPLIIAIAIQEITPPLCIYCYMFIVHKHLIAHFWPTSARVSREEIWSLLSRKVYGWNISGMAGMTWSVMMLCMTMGQDNIR